MKLIPLNDKVLLLRRKEEIKHGSILLPETADLNMHKSIVVSVGGQVKHVKIGELVYHSAYCGSPIEVDRVEYKLVQEKDITAIIEEE